MVDLHWTFKPDVSHWYLYADGLFVTCLNSIRLDDGFVFSSFSPIDTGIGRADLPELDDAKRFIEAQYVLEQSKWVIQKNIHADATLELEDGSVRGVDRYEWSRISILRAGCQNALGARKQTGE